MTAGRSPANRWLLRASVACFLVIAFVLLWQPVSVAWHNGRAKRYLLAQQNEQALRELRLALQLDSDRAETHFLLARTHRRLGNLAKVPTLLRRAVKLGGPPERAQRETWLLLAQSGRLREAEPHLANLLMDPRDDGPDICEAFVQGYFANLRVDEALQLLDVWQKQYPDDAKPHFMRAYLLDALSLFPEAVAAYREGLKRCLDQSPDNCEAAAIWATCLFERDEIEKAQQVLEPLLGEGIDDFQARKLAGQIALAEGRFEDALPHLLAAVGQRPYDTTARYALAKALQGVGRTEDAQPHLAYVDSAKEPLDRLTQQLNLAVEQPRNVELRFEIATTLLKYGSQDDAARWLQSVLQLEPDHQGAREALADLYQKRGHESATWPLAGSEPGGSDSSRE
jgi:tetratricopeptide (TPR) repeat protein